MTAAPVNKEAIRVLVIQHGQREAARIAGLNEDTVCSWAHRYGWSKTIASKPQARTGNTQLVEKISDELAENERQTRLSLSRYAKKAAQDSEKATLRDSPYVKQAAQTAAIVHRWDQKDQATGNVVVNVAILGISPDEVQVKGVTVDPNPPA
jgi:hypothetical protein